MLRLFGPWTHQAHVTAKDIDRLRQLVEMEPPQRLPDPHDSRIIDLGLALVSRVSRAHGSQLEDFERPSISPYASADRGWARGPRA